MIPIRDVIPSRTMPKVTVALLVVNVLIWVGLRLTTDGTLRLILTQGLVPAHFSWPTAIMSLFVHVESIHVVSNMLGLWIFGSTLEDRLGHLRFFVFYLMAGLAGALIAVWAAPASMTSVIGASGAVAGVMTGYLALFPRSRVLVLVPLWRELDLMEVPASVMPALWLVTQTLWSVHWTDPSTLDLGLNLWAVAGGGAMGVLTVWLFRQPARQRVEWWGA